MDRFTISLDDDLLAQFAGYMKRKGYDNRSEAIRDILRDRLETDRLELDDRGDCVACLSYIYNHHERDLASRVIEVQHAHHDLVRSTLHVHLDHENCMEVTVLEGPIRAVRSLANALITETGVRHGNLSAVPVDIDDKLRPAHAHGKHVVSGHNHRHLHPKT